jgi:hypothetical protein
MHFLIHYHTVSLKKITYHTKPKAPIPTGWRSTYLTKNKGRSAKLRRLFRLGCFQCGTVTYLVVTSKTVPKIDSLTNSAIMKQSNGENKEIFDRKNMKKLKYKKIR